MSNAPRRKSATDLYHVMAKGINKEHIFNQTRERNYLKKIIIEELKDFSVEIYSYCIMSNHLHMVLKAEPEELSSFMAKVLAHYANYYNYKHDRNGHVFQNRFKSQCIENESYFWACIRYIHLNPVKVGLVEIPEQYKFSSMQEYCDQNPRILHEKAIQLFKEKFGTEKQFLKYHGEKTYLVFIDQMEEELLQQQEIVMQIMRDIQKEYQLEKLVEVTENIKIRKKYKSEIRKILNISNQKTEKLYHYARIKSLW